MTPTKKPMAQRIGFWLTAAAMIAATWTIAAAQETTKKFIVHEAPKPIAAIQFEDGEGQLRSLADFHGKVVLLNIWATWCVPCRKEMPALDRLRATLGNSNFEVVALSIDRGGVDVVRKFFAEVGIQQLAVYIDPSGKAMRALRVVGLPTTLLVDRDGREIARLIGPAEWDTPDMVEFVKCTIFRDDAAQSQKDPEPAATPPCGERSLDLPAGGTRSNRQP
jgi:thiol-disulfide isomerase/thioredoxin